MNQKDSFIETLRTRNHELITKNQNMVVANIQLIQVITNLEEQSKEREQYVRYLETIIAENGWTPGKDKQ